MVVFTLALVLCGCMDSLENQTKKSENSIIGKKTQDIGKFDANAGNTVSDSKVRVSDPILSGPQAYGPMLEQISKTYIAQAVNLFQATNDRYPKDYDEFMEQIIKANRIELPVLPAGKKYQYDVENHKLVVIDAPTEAPSTP
jgi:hypothetical protein